MAKQPIWKQVAQLGDMRPLEYGGLFVFEDESGVYPPEAEHLESPEDDNGKWIVHRFTLEPCTFQNGILSDNKFHSEHPAWFADKLGEVAISADQSPATLIDCFVNGNTMSKAMAWNLIGEYFGFDNLDSYPLILTRAEVEERYPRETWRM